MGIKNFTPLHNDKILLDVIAKGRLNKSELRISAWVWRYSWGFNDKKKNRRQDWTKATTQREIAKEIEMDEAVVSKNINRMVKANILLKKGDRYQFNEHQGTWNLTNRQLDKSSSLTNRQVRLDKSSSKLDESSSFSSVNNRNGGELPDPKETIKKLKEKKLKPSCEAYRLSRLLWDLITERQPNRQLPDFEKWAKIMDLLLRGTKGERPMPPKSSEEVEETIRWVQEDDFEQNNVLSPYKLRKRYDDLRLKQGKAYKKANREKEEEEQRQKLLEKGRRQKERMKRISRGEIE